jgi:hypothetical protein
MPLPTFGLPCVLRRQLQLDLLDLLTGTSMRARKARVSDPDAAAVRAESSLRSYSEVQDGDPSISVFAIQSESIPNAFTSAVRDRAEWS